MQAIFLKIINKDVVIFKESYKRKQFRYVFYDIANSKL